MLIQTIEQMKNQVQEWKKKGYTIGCVPTMGALHEGHASLIEKAEKENDKVVVTIFVNPTQFGPNEDYASYPRTIEEDQKICQNMGAAAIFNPSADEMYHKNRATSVSVSGITEPMCGAKRPGHFDGVCLVVTKLFNIISPNRAYFGQKDAQQVAVIKRMVEDLNIDVEIVPCPIVREADGLAKSSRNRYLSTEERKAAVVLNQSLQFARSLLDDGESNAHILRNHIVAMIEKEPLAKIDYVEILDRENLRPIEGKIQEDILIGLAVYIGKARLIDNMTYAFHSKEGEQI